MALPYRQPGIPEDIVVEGAVSGSEVQRDRS